MHCFAFKRCDAQRPTHVRCITQLFSRSTRWWEKRRRRRRRRRMPWGQRGVAHGENKEWDLCVTPAVSGSHQDEITEIPPRKSFVFQSSLCRPEGGRERGRSWSPPLKAPSSASKGETPAFCHSGWDDGVFKDLIHWAGWSQLLCYSGVYLWRFVAWKKSEQQEYHRRF